MFPEDDEASQFDLDIHAIVELADTGQIAVVNHLGVGADLRATMVHRIRVRRRTPPRRDPAARLRRRRREGDRPRRPPGDVTAPRRAPGRRAGDPAHRLLRPVASTRTPHKSPSASSPLLRRARRRTALAGSPSAVKGGSGWSKRITDVSVRPGGRPPSISSPPCWWHVGPPSGLRAAPWAVPVSTTTTGSNWGEEGLPSSTWPVEPSWRPPASATTWPGEAAAWRWSWRTACPVVWAAAASCTRCLRVPG